MYRIRILGIRGVPARHGGFETFAERLALYLSNRGWAVTVYCQEEEGGSVWTSGWNGVERVHVPVGRQGAMGTVLFDWKSARLAAKEKGLVLTLGYNTAIFWALYRLKRIPNIANMDGIEWRRDKWSSLEKAWLYANEWAGRWLGNHLVADHPEIEKHLGARVAGHKITMIPYGADEVQQVDDDALGPYELDPQRYGLVIARPEPENSILEIVTAFSAEKRGIRLVVLGNWDQAQGDYRDKVLAAASPEVIFPGAIYDQRIVKALRYYALFYVHGHQVGGTNPSLVEALGAGSAVLAHDNPFNRWVAGPGARYFADVQEGSAHIGQMLEDRVLVSNMKQASRRRFEEAFRWEAVLKQYENLLVQWAQQAGPETEIH